MVTSTPQQEQRAELLLAGKARLEKYRNKKKKNQQLQPPEQSIADNGAAAGSSVSALFSGPAVAVGGDSQVTKPFVNFQEEQEEPQPSPSPPSGVDARLKVVRAELEVPTVHSQPGSPASASRKVSHSSGDDIAPTAVADLSPAVDEEDAPGKNRNAPLQAVEHAQRRASEENYEDIALDDTPGKGKAAQNVKTLFSASAAAAKAAPVFSFIANLTDNLAHAVDQELEDDNLNGASSASLALPAAVQQNDEDRELDDARDTLKPEFYRSLASRPSQGDESDEEILTSAVKEPESEEREKRGIANRVDGDLLHAGAAPLERKSKLVSGAQAVWNIASRFVGPAIATEEMQEDEGAQADEPSHSQFAGDPQSPAAQLAGSGLQLPPGWQLLFDAGGRPYYVDTINQLSSWEPPPLETFQAVPLPEHWTMERDALGRAFYIDHQNQRTTWDHPELLRHLEFIQPYHLGSSQQAPESETQAAGQGERGSQQQPRAQAGHLFSAVSPEVGLTLDERNHREKKDTAVEEKVQQRVQIAQDTAKEGRQGEPNATGSPSQDGDQRVDPSKKKQPEGSTSQGESSLLLEPEQAGKESQLMEEDGVPPQSSGPLPRKIEEKFSAEENPETSLLNSVPPAARPPSEPSSPIKGLNHQKTTPEVTPVTGRQEEASDHSSSTVQRQIPEAFGSPLPLSPRKAPYTEGNVGERAVHEVNGDSGTEPKSTINILAALEKTPRPSAKEGTAAVARVDVSATTERLSTEREHDVQTEIMDGASTDLAARLYAAEREAQEAQRLLALQTQSLQKLRAEKLALNELAARQAKEANQLAQRVKEQEREIRSLRLVQDPLKMEIDGLRQSDRLLRQHLQSLSALLLSKGIYHSFPTPTLEPQERPAKTVSPVQHLEPTASSELRSERRPSLSLKGREPRVEGALGASDTHPKRLETEPAVGSETRTASPSSSAPVADRTTMDEKEGVAVSEAPIAVSQERSQAIEDLKETLPATPSLLQEPLPPGWEAQLTENGRIFYIDHINQTTSWEKPLLAALPSPKRRLGPVWTETDNEKTSPRSPPTRAEAEGRLGENGAVTGVDESSPEEQNCVIV